MNLTGIKRLETVLLDDGCLGTDVSFARNTLVPVASSVSVSNGRKGAGRGVSLSEIASTAVKLAPQTQNFPTTPDELLEAIERDSESLARLLQACGSSRNFGPKARQEFETLLRHRHHLLAKLENLRSQTLPV